MSCFFVYVTAPDKTEAMKIGECLVEERLAACVNVLGSIESVYRWKGKIERDEEVAFVAKTTDERLEELMARIKALHSYECPCIVALPIQEGSPDFLKWIAAECRPGT
jgi:periplasmic divalent cation tolerance protein